MAFFNPDAGYRLGVQCRTICDAQLHFEPYTILPWTAQSLNMHMHLKAMLYLLNNILLWILP